MTRYAWLPVLAGGMVALWVGQARAQEPAPANKSSRVITISEVTIVGRVQKPIAAVDVSRIQPKLTLAQLHQPFWDRIEKVLYRDPF